MWYDSESECRHELTKLCFNGNPTLLFLRTVFLSGTLCARYTEKHREILSLFY